MATKKNKKSPAKKKTAPAKKTSARLKAPKTPVSKITPEQQIVGATFLGKILNYYSHLAVATVVLEAPLSVGDTIRVKGHTTDLTQKVDSIQVEHASVPSASAGEGVGLRLADRVRRGDAVYKC